jgi:hypothetical protein
VSEESPVGIVYCNAGSIADVISKWYRVL